MISLVQENAFSPRPIRRELKSILHLFENEENFDDVELEGGGKINGSGIARWMAPLMANYCKVRSLLQYKYKKQLQNLV